MHSGSALSTSMCCWRNKLPSSGSLFLRNPQSHCTSIMIMGDSEGTGVMTWITWCSLFTPPSETSPCLSVSTLKLWLKHSPVIYCQLFTGFKDHLPDSHVEPKKCTHPTEVKSNVIFDRGYRNLHSSSCRCDVCSRLRRSRPSKLHRPCLFFTVPLLSCHTMLTDYHFFLFAGVLVIFSL